MAFLFFYRKAEFITNISYAFDFSIELTESVVKSIRSEEHFLFLALPTPALLPLALSTLPLPRTTDLATSTTSSSEAMACSSLPLTTGLARPTTTLLFAVAV